MSRIPQLIKEHPGILDFKSPQCDGFRKLKGDARTTEAFKPCVASYEENELINSMKFGGNKKARKSKKKSRKAKKKSRKSKKKSRKAKKKSRKSKK